MNADPEIIVKLGYARNEMMHMINVDDYVALRALLCIINGLILGDKGVRRGNFAEFSFFFYFGTGQF
jgi:hypothetical protein